MRCTNVTLITGFILVTAISSLAIYINDRFHLGGYLEEDATEANVMNQPDFGKVPVGATAGKDFLTGGTRGGA